LNSDNLTKTPCKAVWRYEREWNTEVLKLAALDGFQAADL
jgi:hypothetical protein